VENYAGTVFDFVVLPGLLVPDKLLLIAYE